MSKKFPAEVHGFILANYRGISSEELSGMVNRKFGMHTTAQSMRSYKKNYRLWSGTKKGVKKNTFSPVYPPGMYEFIRDECRGLSRKDTAEVVNRRFGEGTITPEKAAVYRKNHGLPNGRDTRFRPGQEPVFRFKKGEYPAGCEKTWFKKGNVSLNHCDIGEIRRRNDGYLIVKVKEKGRQCQRWRTLSHIIYEQNFGPVPEGMLVGFKDGDINNLDPGNLFVMTRTENIEMNRRGKRSNNPEVTEARLALARLKIKTGDIRKERKDEKGKDKTG